MARVATDENHHFLFYRDLVSAALEIDPSATVKAIERQVRDFEMPGTGIPGFEEHALAIAKAGIYDLQIHHDQILVPVVLRHWDVASLEGLDARPSRRATGCSSGSSASAGPGSASPSAGPVGATRNRCVRSAPRRSPTTPRTLKDECQARRTTSSPDAT